MDKNEAVRGLQDVSFELLKAFDKICNENDIEYVIYYGTLLGAVRHKGFIPWDDDIDVCVDVENFKKLMSLDKSAIPEGMHFCGPETDVPVYNLITSFAMENTTNLSWWNNSRFSTNISIDIFVLRDLANDPETRKKQIRRSDFWRSVNFIRNVALSPSQGKTAVQKIKYAVLYCIHGVMSLFHISNKWIYNKYLKATYCDKPCDYYTAYDCSNDVTTDSIIKKSDVFPTTKIDFNGYTFSSPNNPDAVLKGNYGDYMTLPPIGKRENPTPRFVKLKNGDTFGVDSRKK